MCSRQNRLPTFVICAFITTSDSPVYFFVRHIDFRLNQLSHMLGCSAIELGVLENIKVDAFLVHFRFYSLELCGSLYCTDFHLKSDDTTLVSGDAT